LRFVDDPRDICFTSQLLFHWRSMPRLSLSNLGAMVKRRRGAAKLRETAKEIGISAPTLLRVESGRLPDLDTFGKICGWLAVDPGDFLGRPSSQASSAPVETTISAHFKADKLPEPDTLKALARMLLLIVKSESSRRVDHDA
jgi:transcriptional regulator with XRE-family HTH domain